ncbi:hypothetical protein DAT606_p0022 (plasmid) [Melissococcus plutonius]|uniref:Uncharacterized protein n=1 Tax=Melissococcus plutonius TaxID=33970 RepID=A0A2Z5Y502_9ENTE|nr:hypothetical protein DAT561_p0026 [Melissococcus plutonius]BBD17720.1 hypothetical protein DAT606_p0022 [Melissococcus plutonius]
MTELRDKYQLDSYWRFKFDELCEKYEKKLNRTVKIKKMQM